MPTKRSPRKGSLQFWPRKRVSKSLPRVNWDAIDSGKNIKGFICYKTGMFSAYVRDDTPHSMTKGKKISIPVTILECPPMKIFSVRFYKNGKVAKEILAENLDRDLKKKVKKAMKLHGPRYIQIDTPCPSVWSFASHLTFEIGRLGVNCGLVPLFEKENGAITAVRKIKNKISVNEYLKGQKRYRHLFTAQMPVDHIIDLYRGRKHATTKTRYFLYCK